MANVKISALTSLSSVADSTTIPVVDSGTNYKITASQVKTYLNLGNISTINKDGNASNVLYGNGVFSSLTSSLGNISTINKDGNASNVLYGNGVFASAPNYSNTNVASYLSSNTVPQSNVSLNANIVANSSSVAFPILFANAGNSQVYNSSTLKFNPSTLAFTGAQTGTFGQSITTTSILPSATSVSIFNSTSTTINMGGAAYVVNVGASNVNMTLGGGTGNITSGNANLGNLSKANYFQGDGSLLTNVTVAVAGNIQGSGTNVSIVAGSYTYLFDNAGNFTMPTNSDIVFSANTTLTSVTGTNGNITVNPDGTGQFVLTSITPATFGNTLTVAGSVTSNGATNGTGFLVGNSAVNNVALGFSPTAGTAANMAIRDLSTVTSTMYFDVVTGSTSTGTFLFRTSNNYTQLARIDTNGLTLPTRPAFRVYGNGSQSITSGNLITNAIVDYNQGSAYVNTSGTFTAPVTGLYQVFLNARAGGTAGLSQAGVFKNGQTSAGNVCVFWEITTNATQTTHFGESGIVKLTAGDTLVAKCVAGSITFDSNDSWGAAFIG